ncbi:MAG TPA: sulfatase [Lacipirellulaceae bacterium]|nr:sulfatase [Lacipirellulaceae bacterium]
MKRPHNAHRMTIFFAAVLLATVYCLNGYGAASRSQPNGKKLNVILFLADDFGWTDLACFGSHYYESPNIDRLAREGMKFTQNYSACTVCSPSRAALMTGKYPARLHLTDWIPGLMPENPKLIVPDWTKYLPLTEVTIANAMHNAGYATASIGKWHLGTEPYYPDKHGFDINIAGTDAPNTKHYFSPYHIATLTDGPNGEYVTDRLTSEAIHFIDSNAKAGKPFFLYLPHFAVHLPLQAKKRLIEKYKAKLKPGQAQSNPIYAAMIDSLDQSMGRIRHELKRLNIADNTLVIFESDNGGRVPTTSNLPLRVGKGSAYEGGVRVPMIVYWPHVTEPGSECDSPVIGMDLVPTILDVTGTPKIAQLGQDGVSLVPLLKQTGKLNRDELFWHYPHYQHYQLGGATPYGAIRKGDYKLIEFFEDMHVELYNLRDDIGEQRNLAGQMPEKVNELRNRLHQWRKEVGAQMPTPNPKYDPSKPEHTSNKTSKQPAKKLTSTSVVPDSGNPTGLAFDIDD